jgi:hypothetical protein
VKLIRLQEQWQMGGWTSTPALTWLDPPQYATVNDKDYPWLMFFDWYLIRDDINGYKFPHAVVEFEHGAERVTRVVTMHRLVMAWHVEKLTGPVYHRSRDKLDNRFENLTLKLKENEAWSEAVEKSRRRGK